MSHDDSSIPAADKEGNELWIATYGNVKDPASHAPDDTVLGGEHQLDNSQIKNNPHRTSGSSVKYSDFNVDGIDTALEVAVPVLHKGEETLIEVKFINAGIGFIDEIRHNPNNFSWYVKPGDEGKIRVSSIQTTTDPSKYGDIHDAGGNEWMGFRCRIQNIQPCGTEDDTAHIVCKFKDGFNGSLTASEGYDVELTGQVTLKKTDLNMTISTIQTGNGKTNVAYDNEIDQDVSGTSEIAGLFGLNRSKYNPLGQSPVLRSPNGFNCDDILIGNEQSITCSSETLLNGITQFDVEWLKYHSGDDEWKQVLGIGDIDHRYTPREPDAWGNANVGILSSTYVNNLKSDRNTKNRLTVQGSQGGGKYKAVVTVKGEISGQTFECTFTSNEVEVFIYSRIKPFTVQGQATGCTGETTTLTVTPQVQSRPTQGLDDDITDKYILYELFKHNASGVPEVLNPRVTVWRGGVAGGAAANADPFNMTVPAQEGFYSVRACWVDGHQTEGIGDPAVGSTGSGKRWSEPRKTPSGAHLIPWSTYPTDTPGSLGEWYYSASYRQMVMGVGWPENIIVTSKNMYATKIDITWDIPSAHAGRAHELITYEIDGWKGTASTPLGTSNPANPGTIFTKTVHGETSTDRIHRVEPGKMYQPGPAGQFHIRVNGVFTGDMDVAAVGDTNKVCEGNWNWINHGTRTCAWLKEHRIPIPAPTPRATNAKKNDVRIDWKYSLTSPGWGYGGLWFDWTQAQQVKHELENTTRTNYYRTLTRERGKEDPIGGTAWVLYTDGGEQTIPNRPSAERWHNAGDFSTYNPGKEHDNAVDVKYEVFTRYTDKDNTDQFCDSNVVETPIHKTVDKDGVYSWTPYASEPSANKAHEGRVIALTTTGIAIGQPYFPSGSDVDQYAGGIYVDNIPRLRVTGIAHPKRVPSPGSISVPNQSSVKVSLLGGDADLPTHATLGEYTMTLNKEAAGTDPSSSINYDFKADDISKNRTFFTARKTEFSLPLKTISWTTRLVSGTGGSFLKDGKSPQKKRFVPPKGQKIAEFHTRSRRFTRS